MHGTLKCIKDAGGESRTVTLRSPNKDDSRSGDGPTGPKAGAYKPDRTQAAGLGPAGEGRE